MMATPMMAMVAIPIVARPVVVTAASPEMSYATTETSTMVMDATAIVRQRPA